MFEPHPTLTLPSEESFIWRYMSLTKLIALLCNDEVRFTRLDRFEDPYEATYALPNIEAASSRGMFASLVWPGDVLLGSLHERGVLRRRSERLRKEVFANCWHVNQSQSAAMWDLYGGEGVAIRSTVGRLCKSFAATTESIYIGEVTYLNYEVDKIPEDELLLTSLCKRKSFEHERELRALIQQPVPDTAGEPDWSEQPTGLTVSIDVRQLIEVIYVAPRLQNWVLEVVDQVVQRFNYPEVPVKKSDLYDPRLA